MRERAPSAGCSPGARGGERGPGRRSQRRPRGEGSCRRGWESLPGEEAAGAGAEPRLGPEPPPGGRSVQRSPARSAPQPARARPSRPSSLTGAGGTLPRGGVRGLPGSDPSPQSRHRPGLGGGSVRSVPLACAAGAGTGPLGTPGSAPGWGRCTHRRWEARGEAALSPWVPRGEGSFCERPIGQRAGDSARDLQRDQPGLLLLELQLSGWGSQGLCRWQLKPAAGLCQLMGLSLGAV